MKTMHSLLMTVFCALPLLLISIATGYASSPGAKPNPVPFVNAPLVPDGVAPGGPDFKLTVNGTGFVADSEVLWNGTALATTFLSPSQLSAVVPAADIAVAGTASVSVSSPTPGGGVSNVELFSIRASFSAASFGQSILKTGAEPIWVVAADLNGDGKLDLATSLFGDSAIAISLGNGDGTFQPSVQYPLDGPPSTIIAEDLNGDGVLDLAITVGPQSVAILLGNGDGTFRDANNIDLGSQGVSVAAADFNRDGNVDIAVTLTTGSVVILLGNGDGTFQPAQTYQTGQNRGFGITAGDFNGDGSLDLAVTGFGPTISVLLGAGDGTFPTFAEYTTQLGAASAASADLNGDGKLDLIVQTEFGWISILLGRGDGTFLTHKDYEIQSGEYGLAVVDFNGDGKPDIVAASASSRRISMYLGKGDGTFVRRSDFGTGQTPVGMGIGDFNGDGKLDVLVVNRSDNTLSLYMQLTSVLSRTYLKFGNVKIGEKSTRKVTFSNIGDSPLAISRIAVVGNGASDFTESDNCGHQLNAGASCKLTIVFAPTSPSPFRKVRVKIIDALAKQKIYLLGTGVN